ncbi:extracellular solute-binding protein [Herbaspirillum robiniae]|uniref:Extracellular solute-binding protein n=2 Tax=Herbaspirillum robiniae TaxID=2014887 RepID=A0A246WPL4_9BURK|nr:extracellular solute-binding protein [Herbaspirillum robiniae]OWY28319.1 sugar ABC transporter substrate-binding protein [Herbaspirillum robiniae]
MNRGRRGVLTAGMAVAAAALLGGCGKREDAAGQPPAAAAEPIVLTALVWAPDWAEEMHRVADTFMREHPDVRINLQFMIGNSVEENLKPKAATDSLPDIISVNPNPYTQALADQGLLADMGDTAAWDNTLEILQREWTSPGRRRFGIPGGLATTLIYYNRDMFERAGIQKPPADFDEFIAAAGALKKAGFTPLTLSGAFPNMLGNGPFSYGFANGVVPHVPDWRARIADGTLALNNAQGAGLFTKLKVLADKKLLPSDCMRTGYDDTLRQFTEGRVAMTFQGTWAAGTLMHGRDMRVGVFPPPWNDKGHALTPVIGSETGFAVAQRSSERNRKAAKQFIDFLYGPGMPIWQSKRQNIPPFKKVSEDMAGDRVLFSLVERMEHAALESGAPGLYYSYLPANTIEVLHGLLQAVLSGRKSPEDAARALQASIRDQARAGSK